VGAAATGRGAGDDDDDVAGGLPRPMVKPRVPSGILGPWGGGCLGLKGHLACCCLLLGLDVHCLCCCCCLGLDGSKWPAMPAGADCGLCGAVT